MKSLFFIIVTILAFSQCGSSNIKSETGNQPVSEGEWKAVSLERVGLTMNIPADFINEEWRNEPDRKDGGEYSKSWYKEYHRRVRANVTVTKDFTLPRSYKRSSSPEEVLKASFENYSTNTYLREVKYLDLNGIKGISFLSTIGGDKDYTSSSWITYRFYQGQAQEIRIEVEAKKDESEKLMEIFDSVRLTDKKIESDKNEDLAEADANGWRTEKLGSADLTINIPSEFNKRVFSGKLYHKGNVVRNEHDKNWRVSADDFLGYEVSVGTIDWEKGFPPDEDTGKVETPEEAVETEYWMTQAAKLNPPVPDSERKVDELKYLEIDGLKGIYISINNSVKDNKVEILWTTFRHYNSNGQKITVSIIGKPAEREKLEKILSSVKFTKK